MNIKSSIRVKGVDWSLKKDATDPTTMFPYHKMQWLNAGCDCISQGQYCCWILGVIPPTPGTLEKTMSVFALGFNTMPVMMSPSTLNKLDMERMHYYVTDYGEFARNFVEEFMGITNSTEVSNRGPMLPFPEINKEREKENDGNTGSFRKE